MFPMLFISSSERDATVFNCVRFIARSKILSSLKQALPSTHTVSSLKQSLPSTHSYTIIIADTFALQIAPVTTGLQSSKKLAFPIVTMHA